MKVFISMKKITLVILLTGIFVNTKIVAQDFSFNQGGANSDYFEIITYEIKNEKILVDVVLGGKKRKFILDTGSSTMITENLYKELKPEIISTELVLDKFNNKDTLIVVSLDEINFGGVIFRNIPAYALNITPDWFECLRVDGIIGSNMLRKSIVQISSKDKTITLTNNQKKLNLNKDHISELKLNETSYPIVKFKIEKVPLRLLFDSGDEQLLSLSNNLMNKIINGEKKNPFEVISKGYGSHTLGLIGVEQNSIKSRVKVSFIEINKTRMRNLVFDTENSMQSCIGAKLLDYGVVTIDYLNENFSFEPFESKIDLTEKKWQISPTMINGQFVVGTVWGELISQIKPEDKIIAIDSINYEESNICDLLKNNLKKKDKILLTIEDANGLRKKIEIEKK